MKYPRIIVCLQLHDGDLVKTRLFERPQYLGDPLNTVRLLNQKKADELVLLDITARSEKREPSWELLKEIGTECRIPLTYGGGVDSLAHIERLFESGIEKIAVNGLLFSQPKVVSEAAKRFGSQSIVASIDVTTRLFRGYDVVTERGRKSTGLKPVEMAKRAFDLGVGEILLQAVYKDGTRTGYDLKLVREVSNSVSIPVIAAGGAHTLEDMLEAQDEGCASGAAAGSFFVFCGKINGVLIQWPGQDAIVAAAAARNGMRRAG